MHKCAVIKAIKCHYQSQFTVSSCICFTFCVTFRQLCVLFTEMSLWKSGVSKWLQINRTIKEYTISLSCNHFNLSDLLISSLYREICNKSKNPFKIIFPAVTVLCRELHGLLFSSSSWTQTPHFACVFQDVGSPWILSCCSWSNSC